MEPDGPNPADHLKRHRWAKGESGNPGGRPKGASIKAILGDILDQQHNGKSYYQLLGDLIYREAMKGKAAFVREILDRVEGPLGQKVEVSGTLAVAHLVIAVPSAEEIGPERHAALLERAHRSAPAGAKVVIGDAWLEA